MILQFPQPEPVTIDDVALAMRALLTSIPADAPETFVISDSEVATARAARCIRSHRDLVEAVDHGLALLDALELSPLALDLVDGIILMVDAAEAADEDREDDDREHDTADAEEDLGWSAIHWQVLLGPNTADGDATALERYGRGFVRSGVEDAEQDDTPEMDDEPEGDGGEPYLSVCEFDHRGDNWLRSGNPTTGWGTDVEAVNEDGSDDGRQDHGWFAGELDVPQICRGMVEDTRRPAVLHG